MKAAFIKTETSSEPVEIDSGPPEDYRQVMTEYHVMVLAAAAKYGIPVADREDAAAEVELRFWKKGGLENYDASLLHARPEGGWRDGNKALMRTAKFSSYFRRFVYLHMMQEMDRHRNRLNRVRPVEGGVLPELSFAADPAEIVAHGDPLGEWLASASRALVEEGYPDLVPVLNLYVEGKAPTRTKVMETVGCGSIHEAADLMELMRVVLAECGLDSIAA